MCSRNGRERKKRSSEMIWSKPSITMAEESATIDPKVSQYTRYLRVAPYAPMEMPPRNVSSRRSESGNMRRATSTSSWPT